MRERYNRHVFHIFQYLVFPFSSFHVIGLEGGYEGDVFVEVIGRFVVRGVRYPPGVEGDEEEGMDQQSGTAVEPFVF